MRVLRCPDESLRSVCVSKIVAVQGVETDRGPPFLVNRCNCGLYASSVAIVPCLKE